MTGTLDTTDGPTPDEGGAGPVDFDAFFAEQADPEPTGAQLRLFGRTYTLPATLPALISLQLQRLQDSARPEDIRAVIAALFGRDALDDFVDNHMSDRQFGVLIIWSMANCAKAGSMSLAEAAAAYDEKEAAGGSGKAPAKRPVKRPAAKKTAARKPVRRAASGGR